MSKARGIGSNRGKGKGKQMEGEEMPMGGPDPAMMQVMAEQTVHASESAPALGVQAPTGVGPPEPLRASVPGDGEHWPPDATRRNVGTRPTPAQALSPGRMQVEQQVHISPAKGGSNTTTTTLLSRSPHAHQPIEQQQPCNVLPANTHSSHQ